MGFAEDDAGRVRDAGQRDRLALGDEVLVTCAEDEGRVGVRVSTVSTPATSPDERRAYAIGVRANGRRTRPYGACVSGVP